MYGSWSRSKWVIETHFLLTVSKTCTSSVTYVWAFGQAVTFNNKIYIIAGREKKSVQYYDPSVSTATWQDYTPLDNIRSDFSAVVAPSISGYSGMTIYILGGMITSSPNQTYVTDDVQILDTVNKKWVFYNSFIYSKSIRRCSLSCFME